MGNIQIFHGHLGRDAQVRDTSKGEVCELNIACDFWKDGQKTAHWFKVTVWRAAPAVKRLQKGDQVLVYAPPYTVETWKGRDGDERQTLVLTAVKVEVLKDEPAKSEPRAAQPTRRSTPPPADW